MITDESDDVSESSSTKLVYLINSLYIGGAEVGMARLLAGLDQSEYEVTIVVLDGHSRNFADEIPSWVTIVDLRVRSGIGICTLKELLSIIRTADVIVGSLFHSSMVARAAKIINRHAIIATWHHADQFKSGFRRIVFYRTAFLSDVVLADSDPVAEMLIDELGLDPDLVHRVPIAGIDLHEYIPVEHRDREEITVGTVGRLSEQKNYLMVLDVAERLRETNIRFEIAGDGESYGMLQDEIAERDLQNVTLHGLVEDVPSFLEGLDIYLQPSRWEGLCITVLEAMAAGLPVVGSDVGGIGRNVEQDLSGFLYEPNDVDGFASGIERLAADPDVREQFGNRGRAIVREGFTQDVLVREFEKAIGTNSASEQSI